MIILACLKKHVTICVQPIIKNHAMIKVSVEEPALSGGGHVSELQTIITIVGTLTSIAFGFIIYRDNVKNEGKQMGALKNDIKHLSEQIFYNQREIKELEKKIQKTTEQLARFEERIK